MSKETKNCIKCGVPGEVIPAGTSKKTGKPYASFMKCKECGWSHQLGEKPKSSVDEGSGAGREIVALLREISGKLSDLLAK